MISRHNKYTDSSECCCQQRNCWGGGWGGVTEDQRRICGVEIGAHRETGKYCLTPPHKWRGVPAVRTRFLKRKV